MLPMRCLLLTSLLLCCHSWAAAQAPLSTNRPNQTESPDPVPKGYAHFELGWQAAQEEEGGLRVREYQFPASVVRFGVHRRLELSFAWAGGIWEEVELAGFRADAHGAGDGGLAAKVKLWGESGLRPRASIRTGVNLPFGQDGFTSHRAEPFFLLLATHSLGDRVSLNYNLGPSWSTETFADDDRDTRSHFNYIVSVDLALDKRLAFSLELFGSAALSASGRAENSLDFSLGYSFGNALILDFIAGRGLAEAASDWFIGSGVTFQLPF